MAPAEAWGVAWEWAGAQVQAMAPAVVGLGSYITFEMQAHAWTLILSSSCASTFGHASSWPFRDSSSGKPA